MKVVVTVHSLTSCRGAKQNHIYAWMTHTKKTVCGHSAVEVINSIFLVCDL